MKAMINVCKGCTDRYRIITEDKITDCHDHCRKYQEAKEEYEAKRDAFKKATYNDRAFFNMVIDRKTKREKKYKGNY